jgi:hypothetical protein
MGSPVRAEIDPQTRLSSSMVFTAALGRPGADHETSVAAVRIGKYRQSGFERSDELSQCRGGNALRRGAMLVISNG